jgi:hypothetical protein
MSCVEATVIQIEVVRESRVAMSCEMRWRTTPFQGTSDRGSLVACQRAAKMWGCNPQGLVRSGGSWSGSGGAPKPVLAPCRSLRPRLPSVAQGTRSPR